MCKKFHGKGITLVNIWMGLMLWGFLGRWASGGGGPKGEGIVQVSLAGSGMRAMKVGTSSAGMGRPKR